MRYLIKFWLWFSKKVDSFLVKNKFSEQTDFEFTKEEQGCFNIFATNFMNNCIIERKKNKKSNLKIVR